MVTKDQAHNGHKRGLYALSTLIAVAVCLMVLLDRPLIRGDGVAYLAWVDTFVLDQDIDFGNQFDRFFVVNSYQIQWGHTTEKWVNIFPFGVAILQAPFYAIGHWFAGQGWWNANPDYFAQMQGVGQAYSLWLMIGANVMTLGTLVGGWFIGRKTTSPKTATLITLALFVGTPLIYYSTISPLNSHNPGAFTYTLFLLTLLKINPISPSLTARTPHPMLYIFLGITAALTVLSRWQLLLVVAPAWPLLLWPQRWKKPIIGMVAAAIALLPLPFVWQDLFGSPFVIPYESASDESLTFLSMPQNSIGVLLQTVYHSPLLILSLVGLFFLWRSQRAWAIYAFFVIALQLWINGGVLDWWAGETYGMRRMSELLPLYILLTAAIFQGDKKRRVAHILLWAGLIYSLLYLLVFINYTWTNGEGVFINTPRLMFRHFLNQAHHWQITYEVWRGHLGPFAWALPGP